MKILHSVGRGLALFAGIFILLNILGEFARSGFDTNHWWVYLGWPPLVAVFLLVFSALLMIFYGFKGEREWYFLLNLRICLTILGFTALFNGFEFYQMLARGEIESGFPIPFSFLVFLVFALIYISPGGLRKTYMGPARPFVMLLSIAFAAGAFPLAQMYCFGKTDYRRPAQAIVVLGARVYADGTPSHALYDRTQTGITLYQQKLGRLLVFSGGPGDGRIHETDSMRTMARQRGVPARRIIQDRQGLNTRSTVENTVAIFRKRGITRILVVSHFYHLPRIKMAYERAGMFVYTVPAHETYLLLGLPWYITREVAALWLYYLRP